MKLLKIIRNKSEDNLYYVNYDNNRKINLLSDTVPIKYLSDGTKVLRSLISTSIKEGNCSDTWKYVILHCSNMSYQIQVVYIDQSYITVACAEYFRINITITDIHRLNSSIWDISNDFQNKHFPINERFCVIPPPYYLDCYEKYHLNSHFNLDYVHFCLQCMIVIK